MPALDKYYLNMDNERYYWCATIIELMKRKYRYNQAKKMLINCPLTKKIKDEGGWAYFHDMDANDWADIICAWMEKKNNDLKKSHKAYISGVTVKDSGKLNYKRAGLKLSENDDLHRKYIRNKALARNKMSKLFRIRRKCLV